MDRKILIIEDDPDVIEIVRQACAEELPHVIDEARTGEEGLERAREGEYELLVLDLSLPGIKGIDLCRELRSEGSIVPVVILTSKGGEIDKILALEIGADDYISKPFSPRELVARIKAVLRRTREYGSLRDSKPGVGGSSEQSLTFGPLTIDLQKREAQLNGVGIMFSRTEFELLELLASNAGKVLSREQILEAIFGYTADSYDSVVTTHISRLRAKLEPHPTSPAYILTMRGVGYRFITPEEIVARGLS